jgi:ubiquinone biosynthesis protein
MGRLLGQLFEITELFDMHLRPELILLQKTMVSVEGVARRLNPDHDLWAASEPVVAAWIRRELGPQAQVRDVLEEARAVLKALSRQAQAPTTPPAVVVERVRAPLWPSVLAVLAFAAAALALVRSFWPDMLG